MSSRQHSDYSIILICLRLILSWLQKGGRPDPGGPGDAPDPDGEGEHLCSEAESVPSSWKSQILFVPVGDVVKIQLLLMLLSPPVIRRTYS